MGKVEWVTSGDSRLYLGTDLWYGSRKEEGKDDPDDGKFELEMCGDAAHVAEDRLECVEARVPPHLHNCVLGVAASRQNDETKGWLNVRANFGGVLTIVVILPGEATPRSAIYFPSASDVLYEGDLVLLPKALLY